MSTNDNRTGSGLQDPLLTANLELYKVFYFTAKCGSVTRAAELLCITQPAVSHAIKQLEQRLNGPLFIRSSRGVRLTSEGEVLFSYIRQAYQFMQAGELKLAELRDLQSGRIRIGTSDTLCKHVLYPVLAAFNQAFPLLRIQVSNQTSPSTLRLLRAGEIDFGLVTLPLADSSQLIVEPLFQQLQLQPEEELAEITQLRQIPLILIEKGSTTRAFIDEWCLNQGGPLVPEFELGSHDLLVQFAAGGFGAASVIREFVRDELKSGQLAEIRLSAPPPPRQVAVVMLDGVPLSTAARRFLDDLLPGKQL